jgi:acyl-CoA thioesterase
VLQSYSFGSNCFLQARALKNSIRIGSGGAVDDQDEHQAAVKARLGTLSGSIRFLKYIFPFNGDFALLTAAATAQGKTVYSFDSSSASVDSSLRFQVPYSNSFVQI